MTACGWYRLLENTWYQHTGIGDRVFMHQVTEKTCLSLISDGNQVSVTLPPNGRL